MGYQQDAYYIIGVASEHGISLALDSFAVIDEQLTIDGMDPMDWITAMTDEETN